MRMVKVYDYAVSKLNNDRGGSRLSKIKTYYFSKNIDNYESLSWNSNFWGSINNRKYYCSFYRF